MHYLKKKEKGVYVLDLEKIKHSEKFDGFSLYCYQQYRPLVAQILDAYKQLYKIEHSFRSFKTFGNQTYVSLDRKKNFGSFSAVLYLVYLVKLFTVTIKKEWIATN